MTPKPRMHRVGHHSPTPSSMGIDLAAANIHLMAPQAYMSFLNRWKDAVVVLPDSGGLQEKTTALDVPCVTLRENTERPVTVGEGSNVLAGTSPERIVALALDAVRAVGRRGRQQHLWDGNAAVRIVDVLAARLVA